MEYITFMSSYKEPSFQERTALANKAKLAALEKLRAKPKLDEATLEARRVAAEAREAAKVKAREEKLAAREQEKAERLERAQQELAAEEANAAKSEEERKRDRDARYAARKNRKGR